MGINLLKLEQVIIKKFSVILVVGVICALALCTEKYFTSNFSVESGDIDFTRLVQIQDKTYNVQPHVGTEYERILKTNYNIRSFIDNHPEIKFSKINKNWDTLDEAQKLDFVRDMFEIYDFKNNNVEFVFKVKRSVPKDTDYLKENGNDITDSYVSESLNLLKKVDDTTAFKEIGRTETMPSVVQLSKGKLIVKYGIIGFILGVILATLVLLIKSIGKKEKI